MSLKPRLLRMPVIGTMLKRLGSSLARMPMIGMMLKRRLQRGYSDAATYWETRYRDGGTSGAGSYGQAALYKAEFVNRFVKKNSVHSVMDFGCGDGNQLSLATYPTYVGLDVSPHAIATCAQNFSQDDAKRFLLYEPGMDFRSRGIQRADLTLSMDVVFHLTEDQVYEQYLTDLFDAAMRYVIVYSSDKDEDTAVPHVRHRRFTTWVATHRPEWERMEAFGTRETQSRKHGEPIKGFFVYQRRRSPQSRR